MITIPSFLESLSRLGLGVLLLASLSCPVLAQVDEARARYMDFLLSVPTAKSIRDLAPYFSREAWAITYDQSGALALAVLKAAYSGSEVVSAKREGHKVRIDTSSVSPSGKVVKAHAMMILEDGVWVIDQ